MLDNINLEFESGKKYAIIGANGSGKTLLLKLISGLLIPTNGNIYINGEELHKDFRFYESMGLIIETINFYDNISGFDTLKLLSSINKKVKDDEIIEVLDKLNLKDDMNKKVKEYSLGMKQRLAIAQAIMENPKVLLLDEPTIALDEKSRDIFFNILDKFKKENATIIIATNEKHDLKDRYDKFVEIYDGKVIRVGDIYEY